MSRTTFALVAAVLISLPCAARADVYPNIPAPVPPGATPQRLSPRQVFYWLDTNHDGYLTLNEFLAAPWIKNKRQAALFFRWMDTNHDGLVSLPEFLAAYARYCGGSGYGSGRPIRGPGPAGGPGNTAGIGRVVGTAGPASGGDTPVIRIRTPLGGIMPASTTIRASTAHHGKHHGHGRGHGGHSGSRGHHH